VKLYNTILNSLSHELRTPIAAIIGAADNLQTNTSLREIDKEQLVTEISKASLRLNQQVENLLNISRLESGHIKPKNDWCDVAELVYDVVKRVEEKNLGRKIGVSIKSDLPLCAVDKGMLDQIIYNLLNNAAIHTEAHCEINITVTCHADLLQIQVEDTGLGFKDVNSKEIFHKFSRTKNGATSVSGLGLSIVKGFTEALGASVELASSQNRGTRFELSFPVKTSHLKIVEQ
jgi:two-component system sensor histidine kinase KdpD